MQTLAKNSVERVSKNNLFSKGRDAWLTNLQLVTQAAERVRSSLGPNGAYKMVSYNRGPERIVKVTKDAVPVLEEMSIQYPSLAVLSEAAKMQRQELGDGVTSFVVLASALLKKAEELISKKIHPNVILDGYLEAAKRALQYIETHATKTAQNAYEKMLENVDCGRGILTAVLRRDLAEAARIVSIDGKLNKDRIRKIRKKGLETSDTQLIKGIIIKKARLHRSMPEEIKRPRIAITSRRIGFDRVEIKMPANGPFHMKFDIQRPQQLKSCQEAERQQKRTALDKVDSMGVNVVFSQQPIDTFSKCALLNMGVLAFESLDREDCSLIANATDAKIVSSLADLQETDIGTAKKLNVTRQELDEIVTLEVPKYATFLLRGSSAQSFDELELLIDNSLTLLKTVVDNPEVVPSCGATEMKIAADLREYALGFSGKQQLAIEGFAEAIKEIPRCLAENNGVNPDATLADLARLQDEGFVNYGICADGSCGNAFTELSQIKAAVIKRASEFVSLMLRIDEQITRKEVVKFHKKQ